MTRRPPLSRARLPRAARLAAVVADAHRLWGPRALRFGRDLAALASSEERALLSTGSLGLDLVAGGLPRGALSEIAGRSGGGVETLSYSALAHCQHDGGLALLVDAGSVHDPDALSAAGVDLDALALGAPASAAEAWGLLDLLVRGDAVDLIVVSLGGLSRAPGVTRTLGRRGLHRVAQGLRGTSTALLALTRPSWDIRAADALAAGVLDTVGGADLARLASLRVVLEPHRPRLTPEGDVAALTATAAVVAYHGLPRGPLLPLETTPHGVHRAREIVDLGLLTGVLTARGSDIVHDGVPLGRGPARVAAALARDSALASAIEVCIRDAWPAPTARWTPDIAASSTGDAAHGAA